MAILLRDLLNKNHHVNALCSQTFLVAFIIIFVTLFLPFFVVIWTHNYWVDTYTYVEQPTVRHMNEILVYVYTTNKIYGFGSTKELNAYFETADDGGKDLSPMFEIMNHDNDQDKKVDSLRVSIGINTKAKDIRNIAILQSVVYSIDSKISADIRTRFFNQFTFPNGCTRLTTQGQLKLMQRENFALGQIER